MNIPKQQTSQESANKIRNLRIGSFVHTGIQLVIVIIFACYYKKYDVIQEIYDSLETILPESDKANKDTLPILRGCLRVSLSTCIFVAIGLMIWRNIYNLKFVKFFDGNAVWFNNLIFYVFYSMATPILCTMITDKKDPFYQYFVMAEIYSAFIMGFPIVIIALILVWYLWCSTAGTREVGRGYQGNTTIIYYEYNETADFGCGGSKIKKVARWGYKLLTVFGLIMPALIAICLDNYYIKAICVIEVCFNIIIFYLIKKIQVNLENEGRLNNKLINNS